ncbi:MAG: hypothetical protein FJ272_11140 [Planctomycetes bacterium]|nr:hypothetical protein [Planctomycetota bacterium]
MDVRWMSLMAVFGVALALVASGCAGTCPVSNQPVAPVASWGAYPPPQPMPVMPGQPMAVMPGQPMPPGYAQPMAAPSIQPGAPGATWIGTDRGFVPYAVTYQRFTGEARPAPLTSSPPSQPTPAGHTWVNTPHGPMLYPSPYYAPNPLYAAPSAPAYYVAQPKWPQATPAAPVAPQPLMLPPPPVVMPPALSAVPVMVAPPAPSPAPPVLVAPQPVVEVKPAPKKDIWYPTPPGAKSGAEAK